MISKQMLELYRMLSEEEYQTAESLAEALKVSSKTVRNQMKNLNEVLKEYGVIIESKHGTGFRIQVMNQARRKDLEGMIRNQEKEKLGIPNSTRERIHYLVEYLLGGDNYVKLDDLSTFLFISKKTLTANLKEVEELLGRYNLQLKRKPNHGIRISGLEADKRLCIAAQEHMAYQMSASMEQDEAMIRSCIHYAFNQYNYHISGVAYRELFLHIEIAILRMLGGNYIREFTEDAQEHSGSISHQIARLILEQVQDQYEIRITEGEVDYLAAHLAGKKMVTEYEELPQEASNQEVTNLVNMMLLSVYDAFQFDFRADSELRNALSRHMIPLIVRLKSDMSLANPLLKEIREQYALAYTMATTACVILNHRYHKVVKEDEIGYIALIFALALEKKQSLVQRKNVLLVCDSGQGSAQLLKYRFQKEFRDFLNEVRICDVEQIWEQDFDHTDDIFTTVELQEYLPAPVHHIDYFLKNADIQLVKRALQNKEAGQLLKICPQELFFPHVSFKSKEEALGYLCGYVQSIGLTTKAFLDSVLAREMLARTSFGELVAMPHPIEVMGRIPFMCVAVLDEPIQWEEADPDSMIRVIFLVSAANVEHYDIQKFYQVTAKLMLNENGIKELIREQTYEKFCELLNREEQAVDREM